MIRLVTIVLFLIAGPAIADTPPPVQPFGVATWKPMSAKKPTTMLKMGIFSVVYEETTLTNVRKAVGFGRIFHQGDAAESTDWLCYTVRGARIWIESGEMGGGERVIDIAVEDGGFAPVSDCPALPATFQPVSFDSWIWVGMTARKVLAVLGPPSHKEGNWLSFDFHGTLPKACGPDYADEANWVLIKVIHGRVVQIHAGQVTSC